MEKKIGVEFCVGRSKNNIWVGLIGKLDKYIFEYLSVCYLAIFLMRYYSEYPIFKLNLSKYSMFLKIQPNTKMM